MKKFRQSVLLSLIIVTLLSTQGRSQSTLVHYWNFNSYTAVDYTDTIHAVPTDYTRIFARTASILYAEQPGTSAAYVTYLDGVPAIATDYDTVNLRQNDTAGIALRTRNPSDSMELLFYIPTTNYKNAVLRFASQSSSTSHGQLHQLYDYSVDSGATWRTSGLNMGSDSAWLTYHRTTITFAGDPATENNSKLIFRIKFSGNTTGTSGNNRFDNVTVDADTLTASSINTVAAANAVYTLYPNPVTDRINILSSTEEAKTIIIYNAAGQTVYMGSEDGRNMSVNIANLSTGNYFMAIRDNGDKSIQTIKFIKQ